MTKLANVALSDTFNSWRIRTNDLILQYNLSANTTGSNTLTTNTATIKSALVVNKTITANTITIRYGGLTSSGPVDFSNTTSFVANAVTIRYGGLTSSGPVDFSNTTSFVANSIELRTPLPIANGGTGAITAQGARENLGVTEMVDVINYGATGDGTTDDSAAFTAALATGKAVYVPAGTYAINSVTLTSGDVIIGASRADVLLKVNANDAGAFTWANGERIRLSNMGCTAAAGVTGARFFNQTDVTNHSAYCVFEDIYTYRDLEFGWRGNFIYSRWQDCNDGQFGNAVGGQTHCMLYSSNSATGGNQSNMNLLINCQAFYGDFVSGTIYIADGWRWLFINCGFEQFSTYAVYAQGIFNVDFQGCWFEFNSGTNVLGTDVTAAPNAQSTYMIFQSCAFFLGQSTTAIVVCKANERISFRDCVLATVPAGTTFTESAGYGDDEQIWFLENNQVLSGTAGSLGLNFNPYAGVAGANVYISADQSTARLALGAGVAGANVFIKTTRSDLAAALGTRRIRQIVEDTLSTAFSTTSAAPQDTGLSVTITPLSASSKIAIIASFAAAVNLNKADGADVTSFIYLEKDGTITCTQFRLRATGTPNSVANNLGIGSHPTIEYYDAPGDTDEHTYKLRAFTDGQTTTTVYINEYGGTGTQVARLTAIEYDDP